MFSHETHFRFNGYINRYDCRICDEQPRAIKKLPEKLRFDRSIFLQKLLITSHDTQLFYPNWPSWTWFEMCFLQDGARCHTTRKTNNMLKNEFGEQLSFRNRPVNWLTTSCDFTPLDYFFSGYYNIVEVCGQTKHYWSRRR